MTQATFLIHPLPPFRLDLTAWALRRRPENRVDRWDGTTYHRVVVVKDEPVEMGVAQAGEPNGELHVTIQGKTFEPEAAQVLKQGVENALGAHVDLRDFYRRATDDQKLALLAHRFRGMKPPRFFSVFEGVVNGIACQQLSLSLGIQLLNRLAENFGLAFRQENSLSYAFPRPQDLAHLKPELIRKLGFNFQKARAIVELSRAIIEGRLDLEAVSEASDQEAIEQLMALHGVGRWTAEYTLLRGMGRWHIFPIDDQGARNGLARWRRLRKPLDPVRAQRILARWAPYRGLIYFHMLMKGLDEAGFLTASR
ncbi:MAG: DNA-3-methyladenine glycosylase family protein [Terriglobia bacterium]